MIKIIALGDSVMWGQGLREREKFTAIVAERLGLSRSCVARYAHSGAVIGPEDSKATPSSSQDRVGDFRGEVPYNAPTLWQQFRGLASDPRFVNEEIELVLVGGGINDVGALRLANPSSSQAELKRLTRVAFCDRLPPLLDAVAEAFDRAVIVVTGYYPIFSRASMVGPEARALISLLVASYGFGSALGSLGAMEKISRHATTFAAESDRLIARAVADLNESLGKERAAFASVVWPAERSVLTAGSWLWGLAPTPLQYTRQLDSFDTDELVAWIEEACEGMSESVSNLLTEGPVDPVAEERFRVIRGLPDEAQELADAYYYLASVGHPNRTGAKVYADSIVEAMKRTCRPILAAEPSNPTVVICHTALS